MARPRRRARPFRKLHERVAKLERRFAEIVTRSAWPRLAGSKTIELSKLSLSPASMCVMHSPRRAIDLTPSMATQLNGHGGASTFGAWACHGGSGGTAKMSHPCGRVAKRRAR